jgi:hypothetical protein
MSVRSFDWRDLPALYRLRKESVFLHNALVSTRGPMLISGAVFSSLMPAAGIYTAICDGPDSPGDPLIGQIIHLGGAQVAQLTFLAPEPGLEDANLVRLLEYFASQVVERGAFRLLADVNEHSQAFDALRQAGFAVYARQRVWQLKQHDAGEVQATGWEAAVDRDLISVRSLYNNLVPGLVQQVEPFPAERLQGMVYRQGGDMLAYVELKYGHRGIWAQPFVHPDAEEAVDRLVDLLQELSYRRSRPIYLCIRSYESWLEPAVEALGAQPGARQAVMVRHLAVPQKALRPYALPVLEGGSPEMTAPIAHMQRVFSEKTGTYVTKADNR